MKNSLFQSSVFPVHSIAYLLHHMKKREGKKKLLMEGATPPFFFDSFLHLFHTKKKGLPSPLSHPHPPYKIQACRPVKPLRIRYPASSLSIRSIKNSRCLFALTGSEATASASASENLLTATGEKMVSRPRTMCRSIT